MLEYVVRVLILVELAIVVVGAGVGFVDIFDTD
jgi:hypothetical protein